MAWREAGRGKLIGARSYFQTCLFLLVPGYKNLELTDANGEEMNQPMDLTPISCYLRENGSDHGPAKGVECICLAVASWKESTTLFSWSRKIRQPQISRPETV